MANLTTIEERTIFISAGTLLLFLMINFDQTLGLIFFGFAVLDYLAYKTDSFASLRTETRSDNRLEAVLYSFIFYGVFLGLAYGALQFVMKLKAMGIIAELSTQVPVLSDVVWIAVVAYGVLVPVIETRFFFMRLMEFFADLSNIDISRNGLYKLKTWSLMGFIATVFTLFHLTAKISSGNIGLITTFLFGLLSCFMVIYFQEGKQAIGLHVVTNTHASLCKYYHLAQLYCGTG